MAKKTAVFLECIAEKLGEISDHWEQHLNTATGEFVALSDGLYIETDEELADIIYSSCDYVRLPNQYDIHEYKIMENFAEATPDVYKRKQLFHALNGKKPFRHFKDTLNFTGLVEAYYAFRFLTFLEIAREWCEQNDIPYKYCDKWEGTL